MPTAPSSKKPAFWAGLKLLISKRKNGAAEWNRTIDLTLTKGMLYRLSYGSNSAFRTVRLRGGALCHRLFADASAFASNLDDTRSSRE